MHAQWHMHTHIPLVIYTGTLLGIYSHSWHIHIILQSYFGLYSEVFAYADLLFFCEELGKYRNSCKNTNVVFFWWGEGGR